jgi:hypothetical protein
VISIADAYDAGLGGDLDAAHQALAILRERGGDEADAWRAALRGLIAFIAPDLGELAPESIAVAPSSEQVAIAACALAHGVRAAALRFDGAGLSRAEEALGQLTGARPSAEAQGWRAIARVWDRVMRGASTGAAELVLEDDPTARRADLVLESASLRALASASAGAVEEALAIARRGSRMSRTESLPQSEYLANLILARVRRLDGKPHLAARILHALIAVASPYWRPWLAFEILLAHGVAPPLDPEIPGAPPILAAARAIEAARSGDRAAFDREAARARAGLRGAAPLLEDLELALAVIDPSLERDRIPAALRDWAAGLTPDPPHGLGGLAGETAVRDQPIAWVFADGARPGRRILAPGVPLVRAEGRVVEPVPSDAKQLRTDSAIAALALEGEAGLPEEALFLRLYGFPYEPARHQSVRDVLYLRIRRRAAPATLLRDGGRVALIHAGPLLVPDPRCTPIAEVRILRILAERRTAAPKEIAAELGIPVRTAQDALSRLAEDGAVKKEKARVGLQYILDDTTFSEPTRNLRR